MDTNMTAVVADENEVARVIAEQSVKARPFIGRPPVEPTKLAIWNEAKRQYKASLVPTTPTTSEPVESNESNAVPAMAE